ncbi:LysR family transcriptional regulator substrate-binding protein [Pseudomonas viridiflava]|uniref:LysR family transcriptional regulator n=1 Tax=Pseudomonas viridiflava TaxID=33069 RepID=A0AA46VWH5_PSEVI|nr:LysR family transcriptional regulator substrate-binding protein [Pseudomonas viridiflava]UZA69346.1 LysR family transcriptional regulator [Pseudomonas viridiflava]
MSGSVTIHYYTHIQETSLGTSLDFLARHYPDIHLNVLHGSEQNPSLEPLIKEAADILILPSTVLGEHYVEHHHWSDHYVLVTAKGKHTQTRTFTELSQTSRYVAWRHPGVDRLHQQLASAQIRLSHRGELSCLETLLDLIARQHCISILPSALLNGHLREVEQVPLPGTIMRHISVVARPTSLLSNAASAVIQALKKPRVLAVQRY